MRNVVNASTTRKIGKTTYLVVASSSKNATDTIDKKLEKMILKDLCENASHGNFSIITG